MSTRIKHVVPIPQVAHLWAHKAQNNARNGGRNNFFFDGPTIYSYGHHFPIAMHVIGTGKRAAIMFTTRSYSNTTSKHIGYVRQSLPDNAPVFSVQQPTIGGLRPDIATAKRWQAEYLASAIELLELATTRWSDSPDLISRAKGKIAKGNKLAKFFGARTIIRPPIKLLAEAEAFAAKTEQRRANHVSSLERRAAERDEKRKISQQQWDETRKESLRLFEIEKAKPLSQRIEEWHNYANVDVLYSHGFGTIEPLPTLLRLKRNDPSTIETSMGAEFSVDMGRRAWRLLSRIRSKGETYQRNGHTIHFGPFAVDSMSEDGTVRAGCHTLDWAEIESLANRLGWKDDSSAGEAAVDDD